MYYSIEKFIQSSLFSKNIKVKNILERLKEIVAEIESLNNEVENTDLKFKDKLCQIGGELQHIMQVNAKIDNYGIELTQTYYYNFLKRKNKKELLQELQRICKEGDSKMDVLIKHGITSCVMKYIDSLITDYSEESTINSTSRIIDKQIRTLFTEGDILLKHLDKEVEKHAKINPDIYMAYMANRSIIAQNKINSRLKGHVLNQNQLPVKDATVSIYGTSFQTKTDETGYYILRNIPFGTIKIVASAYTHEEDSTCVSIEKTKCTRFDFILNKKINKGQLAKKDF